LLTESRHAFSHLHFGEKVIASLFQAITPRTAGFAAIDLNTLKESSYLVTIIFMFIGGSPGSTAGGIKTVTLAVLFLGAVA
ncbi:MAG TPA: Trk family potassium uptake protein, partial [Clostridiales bacterium]|nr:Trk family potassium uptake protein [Clostridiales bacterium]